MMPEKIVTRYNLNWTYGGIHQCPPGGAIIPQQVYQPFLLCLVRPVGSSLPLPEGCWQRANLRCGLLGTNHVSSGDPWCFTELNHQSPFSNILPLSLALSDYKVSLDWPVSRWALKLTVFLQVLSIPLQRILNASIHSGTRCLHSSHQERTCLLLLQFPINGEQLEAFQVNSPYRRFTHSKQKLGANSSTRNQINKLWCSHISV